MIALASGRPVPEATVPPTPRSLPTNFMSDQPGGRGVPEPPFPETQHPVFDAETVDTSEPAPMRFYHPNGDDYEDVPQGIASELVTAEA